ncbi:hypothetical protein ABTX82_40025 [Streptomyces lavendulae]|uniref:hypothetical protein n=1 Tax=Streptomyces lavendulae TaxID=1914 RepID=UPI00332EA331
MGAVALCNLAAIVRFAVAENRNHMGWVEIDSGGSLRLLFGVAEDHNGWTVTQMGEANGGGGCLSGWLRIATR